MMPILDEIPNGEAHHHIDLTLEEFSQLLESQPIKWHHGSWRRRQIDKVPPQLRLRGQKSEHVYDPVMVSLGPYHHGKPELRRVEEFKHVCLDWCAKGDEEKKTNFYNKVLKEINKIRGCYSEATILEKYDDKALALMMLLDACFIINFMENCMSMETNNVSDWLHCLGIAATIRFTPRDIMLLENQIPFHVIKLLLMSLDYEKHEAEEFLQTFVTWIMVLDRNPAKIPRENEEPRIHAKIPREYEEPPIQAKIPGENEEPPIHLLEACWRVFVEKNNVALNQQVHYLLTSKNVSHTCLSVMDLKAKGIQFRPSSTHSFTDITFKSHAFYGQLQLPVRYVSEQTKVFLSNLIAYEVSPHSKTNPVVLSFAIFMKSLIESPADVKELQEKGILLNKFVDHEQVVTVFKEIDTFELLNVDIFEDVKRRIAEHCNNRTKTWIADLIHTWFQSPWSAIALFAATLLLCLTLVQTLFTIRPVN